MRSVVSPLATFQADTRRGRSASRSAAVGRTVTTRPLHRREPPDRLPRWRRSVRGRCRLAARRGARRQPEWLRRRPGPGAPRCRLSSPEAATASTRTRTVSPIRSSARWVTSSSARSCDPGNPLGDRLLVELAGIRRLRCRPRRSSRTRRSTSSRAAVRNRSSSSTSASVSPGKPTITLLRAPARGASSRMRPSRSRKSADPPKRRIRRSTVPAGVLERQIEVRRHAGRGRDRLDERRAQSRLAAGRTPGPVRCRRQRPVCGSSASSARRSPRSLPYDVEFSLTSTSSRAPVAASHRASASTSAGGRDTNEPRKDGIAQNAHRRSQPDASFRYATGPSSSRCRRRVARQRVPGQRDLGGGCRSADRGDGQQRAPVAGAGAARRVGRPRRRRAGRRCRRRRRSRAPRPPRAATRRACRRTARPGSRPPPPGARCPSAASRVSIESFFAESTKPQVFTTTTSASPRRR